MYISIKAIATENNNQCYGILVLCNTHWKYTMRLLSILAVCVAAVAAAPPSDLTPRIVGGTTFTIQQWPQMANVLFTWNMNTFEQFCGGTILSVRFILTAGHCINFHAASRFRVRVGSALASSGGTSHVVDEVIPHPFYNPQTEDLDIGLIRTINNLTFTAQVQAARLANGEYALGDNEEVQAPGWGAEHATGPRSEELHVVQIWTVNQSECAQRYRTENIAITDNMLCAGWLNVGGRGQCATDGGGPLVHKGTVVGVFSFTFKCGTRFYPGVSTRVSRVADWINANTVLEME